MTFIPFTHDHAVNCNARAHALAAWPEESCGLVVNDAYVPCDNLAEDKTNNFIINPALILTPGIQAIVHSHPNDDNAPSQHDMEQQIATNLPYGIVRTHKDEAGETLWFGDQLEPPPLIGRNYRFGPSGSDGKGDCYAVIRDWYWTTKNIRLREVPRDVDGFRKLTPWYKTLFTPYGWEQISPQEAKTGDVVLCQVMQNIPNHALLLLDNGLCLHHLENRLSRTEPVGPWLRYRTHVLRYTKT